jgi:hypothetical protein
MEVADGKGTQSEILRFAQNDSACIFLPFADFFTPPFAVGHNLSALWACESGGEKHFAGGDRLKLALMGRCPGLG